jgi:hypothetical protein
LHPMLSIGSRCSEQTQSRSRWSGHPRAGVHRPVDACSPEPVTPVQTSTTTRSKPATVPSRSLMNVSSFLGSCLPPSNRKDKLDR